MILTSFLLTSPDIAFLNSDGTSWGRPWENVPLGGYTTLGKGGAIDGFQSEVRFIPELQLGMVTLTNSPLSMGDPLLNGLKVVLPALTSYLNSLGSPPLPQPKDPAMYLGYYNLSGSTVAQISRGPTGLLLGINLGFPMSLPLRSAIAQVRFVGFA